MFLAGARHANIELGGRGRVQQHTNDKNLDFGCNLLSMHSTPHMREMGRLLFPTLLCPVQSILCWLRYPAWSGSVLSLFLSLFGSALFCSVLFVLLLLLCSGSAALR